jgi:hypothetical protein
VGRRAGGCPCPWRISNVRTVHARRPPRGRAWTASGRARPRRQAAARQAAGAAARPRSGHQGGPRGAEGAEGRERGCQGRRRRAARCRQERRASERGAEPRLHRLRPAAVRHGRRPGEAPDLRQVPRSEAANDVPLRQELPCEPWRLGDARGVPQEAAEAAEDDGGWWGGAAAGSRDRGGAGPVRRADGRRVFEAAGGGPAVRL